MIIKVLMRNRRVPTVEAIYQEAHKDQLVNDISDLRSHLEALRSNSTLRRINDNTYEVSFFNLNLSGCNLA